MALTVAEDLEPFEHTNRRASAGVVERKLAMRPRTGSIAKRGLGSTHIHTAIDAYSRLAYSEFAGTENTANGVAFPLEPRPGSPATES